MSHLGSLRHNKHPAYFPPLPLCAIGTSGSIANAIRSALYFQALRRAAFKRSSKISPAPSKPAIKSFTQKGHYWIPFSHPASLTTDSEPSLARHCRSTMLARASRRGDGAKLGNRVRLASSEDTFHRRFAQMPSAARLIWQPTTWPFPRLQGPPRPACSPGC